MEVTKDFQRGKQNQTLMIDRPLFGTQADRSNQDLHEILIDIESLYPSSSSVP